MRPIRLIACIALAVPVVYCFNAICRAPAVSAAPGVSIPQSHSRGDEVAVSRNRSPELPPIPLLHAAAHLVLVDVVVTDKDKAVHGLDRSHFHIFDNGHERPIANFDEHRPPSESAVAAASGVAAAPVAEQLPPNTYSNAPIYSQTGTLNVLLLDSLNTPGMVANWDVRQQMLEYVSHIPRGTPLAIFTLGSRLQLAQGFTTDMGQLTKGARKPEGCGPDKFSGQTAPDADKFEDKMISQLLPISEASNDGQRGSNGCSSFVSWLGRPKIPPRIPIGGWS